jgi:ATP-dependent Clp protease ATP-binding subunit ClpA
VVLLDEVEKAHPLVVDVFLQAFDAGRLTDARGRSADARHTIFILASNLGTGSEAAALEEVRRFFRPELLNRIDEIIVFDPLTEDDLKRIIELLLGDVRERLSDRKVGLELTDAAKEALVKEGYDPVYGARPLRRTIERRVANPLSRRILAGEFAEGETALVDYNGTEYAFSKAKAKAPKREKEAVVAG